MNENKTLFKFPLINIWYVVITLLLILMRIENIIDWSPVWLLCPLWLPFAIAFSIIIILYIFKGLIYLIYIIYDKKGKKY